MTVARRAVLAILAGGLLMASAAWASTPSAQAAETPTEVLAKQDASQLATAIKAAAKARGSQRPTAVQRQHGELEVAFSARSGHVARYGTYLLMALPEQRVIIATYSTHRAWKPWAILPPTAGVYRLELEPSNQLSLEYKSLYSIDWQGFFHPERVPLGGPSVPETILQEAVSQALAVIRSAERHAPLTQLSPVPGTEP